MCVYQRVCLQLAAPPRPIVHLVRLSCRVTWRKFIIGSKGVRPENFIPISVVRRLCLTMIMPFSPLQNNSTVLASRQHTTFLHSKRGRETENIHPSFHGKRGRNEVLRTKSRILVPLCEGVANALLLCYLSLVDVFSFLKSHLSCTHKRSLSCVAIFSGLVLCRHNGEGKRKSHNVMPLIYALLSQLEVALN